MAQYCVIGLGKFGLSVARELAARKQSLLAIDTDEDAVQEASHYVTRAVRADATAEGILKKFGVADSDVIVVGIGDIKDSILTCLVLKELGAVKIIVKAVDTQHRKVLERIGVETVIIPEQESAVNLVNRLVDSRFFSQVSLPGGYGVIEISPRRKWTGRTLAETDFPGKHGAAVVGLRRKFSEVDGKGETRLVERLIYTPRPEEVIEEHDILVLLGEDGALRKLENA